MVATLGSDQDLVADLGQEVGSSLSPAIGMAARPVLVALLVPREPHVDAGELVGSLLPVTTPTATPVMNPSSSAYSSDAFRSCFVHQTVVSSLVSQVLANAHGGRSGAFLAASSHRIQRAGGRTRPR